MLRGALFAIVLGACGTGGNAAPEARTPEPFATPWSTLAAPASFGSTVGPLPQKLELDPRKVALGARLFSDPRLSGDGKVACSDCHVFEQGGSNGLPHAALPTRPAGALNVPTLFNAAFDFRFGWSGRFENLGDLLDFAMQAPGVMAGSWDEAAVNLARDPREQRAFLAIYPRGLSANSLREVIAFYSLSLVTPNSRFDRYLRGELALAAEEQRGYDLFREYGCISCHQGINIGGNMLQRFGVMRNYFDDRGRVNPVDRGLFEHSAREEDRHVFRVPSLRNVALTAPYFHDGSAASLEQAATTMAAYQLGRTLSPEQARQLAAFLRTLTGELDGKAL